MSKCQGNNLVNIQIIQENNLITNYSPSQKFSLSDKHKNIEISEDETIAIGKLCKGIVICKPSIQGIKRFAFQILELGINEQISVGVSQKQNQDYSPDLTQIDHGCYMITNREVCYPHNNMEFNLITSNFTFGKNDLTIVQINNIHNKITFTKKYSL